MDYLKEWKPGDDIGIMFEDITGKEDPRTVEEINKMFDTFKSAAVRCGFEMKMYGLRTKFEKSVNKTYAHRKWDEGALAMLHKLIKGQPEKYTYLKELIEIDSEITQPPKFEL